MQENMGQAVAHSDGGQLGMRDSAWEHRYGWLDCNIRRVPIRFVNMDGTLPGCGGPCSGRTQGCE